MKSVKIYFRHSLMQLIIVLHKPLDRNTVGPIYIGKASLTLQPTFSKWQHSLVSFENGNFEKRPHSYNESNSWVVFNVFRKDEKQSE